MIENWWRQGMMGDAKAHSARLSGKRLNRGALKVYEKFPHGLCTTHADVVAVPEAKQPEDLIRPRD